MRTGRARRSDKGENEATSMLAVRGVRRTGCASLGMSWLVREAVTEVMRKMCVEGTPAHFAVILFGASFSGKLRPSRYPLALSEPPFLPSFLLHQKNLN